MGYKLGLTVTTDEAMPHALGLARAARAAGHQVELFLTGDGVGLTRHPLFRELLELGRVGVCEVSFTARGYETAQVPELHDKDFVTQARNAEMVEECDRYLVL